MSIPDIGLAGSSVPDISLYTPPIRMGLFAPQLPHGVSMALPVVQIPGCVEAHVDSELQTELTSNDPDRIAIYCDSGMPSFNAMSLEPNYWRPKSSRQIPNTGGLGGQQEEKEDQEEQAVQPPTLPRQELPSFSVATAVLDESKSSGKPKCEPGEIIRNGKCIELVQPDNKIAEVATKYLPPLEAATTTATIATIATVSALVAKPVANFLLKLIKPMIKKIIAKIKKALGKKVKVRSLRERVLAQRARNQLLRQARDLMG